MQNLCLFCNARIRIMLKQIRFIRGKLVYYNTRIIKSGQIGTVVIDKDKDDKWSNKE